MSSPRIVVRAPNWLGDIVMAMPAIGALRRHFPDVVLTVAAPAPFASFCRAIRGVDEVVALAGRGPGALARHAAALGQGHFDIAVLLTNSFVSALAAWRAGIPERWGYRRDFRGPLLTRAVPRPRHSSRTSADARSLPAPAGDPESPEFPAMHHARYYLALLEALGLGRESAFVRVTVPNEARERGRARLSAVGWTPARPLVALAPGAAYGAAKRWPAYRAAEALVGLHDRGLATVLVGAPPDRPAARGIESALAARGARGALTVNLVGDTDLDSLMGVFSWCDVVVSNDSGAMHVASAVGRPVVSVFGPTDERATAPLGRHRIVRHDVWCRPCLLRECPIDHACLEGVTGAQVVQAVESLLERHSEERT
jgi:lipopolysaccharide heptosyltransferase II